jgi:hypothetical protein
MVLGPGCQPQQLMDWADRYGDLRDRDDSASRRADRPTGDLPRRAGLHRGIEPDQEAAWTAAIDRHLELWIANLDRTTMLVAGADTAGFIIWTPILFPEFRHWTPARNVVFQAI